MASPVIVEKQQVQLLASSILEILSQVERETNDSDADMALQEPFEPLWRDGILRQYATHVLSIAGA